MEIGREDLDRNYVIHGHGPRSDLVVTPLSSKYYGHYTCKADNPYGSAVHQIWLQEARKPAMVSQAVLDRSTATTLHFRCVALPFLPLPFFLCRFCNCHFAVVFLTLPDRLTGTTM